MKQTDWDKVKAATGVDRVAQQVAQPGVHYEAGIVPYDYHENPLPTEGAAFYEQQKRHSRDFVDFRGMSFGRLTVIGVAKGIGRSAKAKARSAKPKRSWLCKCACGAYCLRKGTQLRKAMNGGNSFAPTCGRCKVERKILTGDLNPETAERVARSARKRFAV